MEQTISIFNMHENWLQIAYKSKNISSKLKKNRSLITTIPIPIEQGTEIDKNRKPPYIRPFKF